MRVLFGQPALDAEMDEEMREHVELRTQANINAGMNPEEARFAALRQFGWTESIKETCRDQRGVGAIESWLHDLRFGARVLRKSPGFTAVAVLTLALGIGANTAMFSVINAVLLRPPPFESPGQLVRIHSTNRQRDFSHGPVSRPDFTDWQEQCKSFTHMAAYHGESLNLTGNGEPERLESLRTTAGFFSTLKANPQLGRAFLPGEDRGAKVAVLSHRLWERRYHSDPAAVGKSVTLNLNSYTIVGVMPATFRFGINPDLWVPLDEFKVDERGSRFLSVIGRLQPGVTVEQARTELKTVADRIMSQFTGDTGWSASLISLQEDLTGNLRPALLVLSGAVGLVLLIACANIAGLLFARGAQRGKEFAIRAAVGASRTAIVRQLMVECLLLAGMGGGLGIALAAWGIRIFQTLAAARLPATNAIELDPTVLGWALAGTLFSGLVFGLAPALSLARPDLNEVLKSAGRGNSSSHHRWREGLVATQVALSLVLLIGAGLLLKSLGRLRSVPTGFVADNVLTLRLNLPENKYSTEPRRAAFAAEAVERVQALPGVVAVGLAPTLPVTGGLNSYGFSLVGKQHPDPKLNLAAEKDAVTPDYFRAMGIPLKKGRAFDTRDAASANPVLLINEAGARRFFPDEDPLGRQITLGSDRAFTIVGIVADVKQYALTRQAPPHFYTVFAQDPQDELVLFVRTQGPPLNLAASVRDALHRVDPEQPISGIQTMDAVVNNSLAERRFTMLLLACFAGSALVLACIGLYGAIANLVNQRTREMGVRMALGAARGDIVRMVLAHGLKLAGAGLAAGLVASFALTRAMQTLLYEVRPADPVTFVSVSLLLTGVAALACWLPARRAARVDPMVALRSE